MPRPVMGVGATNGNGDGALTAGAGAGAGSDVSGGAGSARRGAGAGSARRGAGSARRGGRCAGRGAVTVTSGSVSDTWLQAGPGEVSHPGNGNALKATAPKSRRFQPESEDDLRRSPAAPNMTPPTNANSPLPRELVNGSLWANGIGNFVQCLRLWTQFKFGLRVRCKARRSSQQPHSGWRRSHQDHLHAQ